MTRAFLLLGGALALAACGHEDPYGTLPTGTDEPLEPGPVARLTVDPGPDEWPAWTPDGHLLYTYRSNTGDNDRCVGLLPGTGDKVSIETDAFEARALQHEIDHLDGALFLDRVAGPHALHARKVYLEGGEMPGSSGSGRDGAAPLA